MDQVQISFMPNFLEQSVYIHRWTGSTKHHLLAIDTGQNIEP